MILPPFLLSFIHDKYLGNSLGKIFNFGLKIILIHSKSNLTSQPRQPLLRIIHLRNTRVSVFPEVEESLVMLYGFSLQLFSS